jgi:transposase
MKKYLFFIGIDVSKKTLDVCFVADPQTKQHTYLVVSNNAKGVSLILAKADKLGFALEHTLFCFENTGVYSIPLSYALSSKQADYWVVPAIEIKRSKGITRGKTDKTDARDIAFYALTHLHKVVCSSLPETHLLKLQLLHAEREKLLKAVLLLKTSHEAEGFLPAEILKEIRSLNNATIKKLQHAQKEVEKKMMELIKGNPVLRQQFELITSVPGVGPLTAVYLIITTKGFKLFANWRKLACYAGVAPFQYSSGTSVKGRTRVHPLANKKLKSLLNMCALNAKRADKEMGAYYERKLKEGKNAMLVMNAVRCKVLARIFATVQRQTPYINLQKFAA